MDLFQHTLKKKVSFSGIGLHSGRQVSMTLRPAAVNSGIGFVRKDLSEDVFIPAFMNRVVDTQLATTIGLNGVTIGTTEHVLSALAGMGIDNAVIELDGPEVPVMDGSAGPFVYLLNRIGRRRQKSCRQMLKITREIAYSNGEKNIKVVPYDGFKVTCEISFDHDIIKKQVYTFTYSSEKFIQEIAKARTFGFLGQVEKLRENGLALGGSLDNAVVIDQYGVLNSEGLRFADEFVRHKILDLIGDFALLGCPIMGHIIASKSGHGQHLGLMREIALHPESWEFVKLEKQEDRILEKVITTTMAAGNKILPFFLPPPATGEVCAV